MLLAVGVAPFGRGQVAIAHVAQWLVVRRYRHLQSLAGRLRKGRRGDTQNEDKQGTHATHFTGADAMCHREAMSRRHAPATLRNRDPILAVLRRVLPRAGVVLEIGSGSGEHAAYFAAALEPLRWQPSDRVSDDFADIAAWASDAGATTVEPAVVLDAAADVWPLAQADAVFSANVAHIAPWSATQGLLRGASRILSPGGPLVLYGPFMRDGRHTAASNAAFDDQLRQRNPSWGIRDLADVVTEAKHCGLELDEIVEMPANNLTLVLRPARDT